jgi:hypothetical protein
MTNNENRLVAFATRFGLDPAQLVSIPEDAFKHQKIIISLAAMMDDLQKKGISLDRVEVRSSGDDWYVTVDGIKITTTEPQRRRDD